MKRTRRFLLPVLVVATLLLTGCPVAAPTPQIVKETVVVRETVVVTPTPVPPEAKKFDGVKLVAVTQTGPYIAGPLFDHRDEWTALTGGQVEVVEVPYENLYEKIMTSFASGVHAYDIIVVGATWLPDFTPYLIPLDDYIANPETNPEWDDILPAFREIIVKWEGKIYGLPLDGDTHTLFYRRHLFNDPENQAKFKEKYGYDLTVPKTMDQLRDVAEFFTGWDWSGDGQPDYGWAQPMARGTQSHWWFWDFVAPFCVLPPGPEGPDRYRGQLYFDPETMQPLINEPCMLRGLELYKEMAKFGPPGMESWGVSEIRSAFPSTGNIAMIFEWGGIPGLCNDPAFAHPDVLGDCGAAPRPGSLEVWDREKQQWIKLDKPNTAPLLNFGGWVGAITKTSPNPDAAYDFLKFLNSPEISFQDVVVGDTGFNVYRYTHVRDLSPWVKAGFAEQDAKEYLEAVRADLENPNVLIDLRIPGKPEYVDTVLDLHVSAAIVGEEEPAAALKAIYDEWEKITDRLGRDSQKAFYRKMMGMD
ncbi:MAG: extracellular solute-binding protein [Anaerolineae bacterium]|nr:extracellular solute-binding protein [Anaerolineae bacterium]MDW8099091.1 extracellular solute-binding protein [Anaerolineae bacterium]